MDHSCHGEQVHQWQIASWLTWGAAMVLLLLVLCRRVGQAGGLQAGGSGCWFAGRHAGPKLRPRAPPCPSH